MNEPPNERSVHRIWNDHWTVNAPEVVVTLNDRFTAEAFRELRNFANPSDTSILDVGCGTGRFSALFAKAMPQCTVTGIDFSRSAIDISQQLKRALKLDNLILCEASAFNIPFADDQFDFVFSQSVVQLFGSERREDALREMIRVTKPGGKVLVSVTNWHCFPHTIYKFVLSQRGVPYEYGYEKSFTRRELMSLFRYHGLRNIECSGYYASYGFYRLRYRLRGFYSRLFGAIGALVDRIDGGWISRRFGFEIMIKGEK